MGGNEYNDDTFLLKYITNIKSIKKVNSLAMEGLDIINVPENGSLLATDIRWCIRAVCMLHVMRGEEVYLLYKLGLTIYQVL